MADHSSMRYAYPAAYYALALDYFQMEPHRHDQWEIMYLVNGTCRVEVEGKVVEMAESQYMFHKKYCLSPKQYRKLNGQNLVTDTGKWQKNLKENGDFDGGSRLID